MRSLSALILSVVLAPVLTGLANVGWSADYHAGPEDYRGYLSRLEPGDRLFLQAGDYARGLPLHNLQGLADRPIVIEGPATGTRARLLARPGANTISVANAHYLVIRNLELDGRNLPVDAVKAEGHAGFAHHITLENLHIIGHGNNQQTVGISTKCPAWGWVIRNNVIEGAGTGIYLGNSDGSAPFVAGLIEGNQISGTLGYNLQIKHQKARPAEMPETGARHDTIIRRNLFSKESNGNTGALARPNVLVGHLPLTGEGAGDRYLIYANLFWQNPAEALFQGEGNVALYSNIFVNQHGPAIHIQPHNDVPRNVAIVRNTVLARDAGVLLRNRDQGTEYVQNVEANVLFAGMPLAGEAHGQTNVTGTWEEAPRYLKAPFASLTELDVSPLELPPAVISFVQPSLPDAEADFFGLPHSGIAGAVSRAGSKTSCPAWRGRGAAQ